MSESTTTIALPGGDTAEVIPPDAVTIADVERSLALLDVSGLDVEKLDRGSIAAFLLQIAPQLNRVLTVVMTRSWSLTGEDGKPLPITMESVGAQRFSTLRPLYEHVTPARAELLASLGLGSVVVDPKSAPGS